jgi:hypothetical protein
VHSTLGGFLLPDGCQISSCLCCGMCLAATLLLHTWLLISSACMRPTTTGQGWRLQLWSPFRPLHCLGIIALASAVRPKQADRLEANSSVTWTTRGCVQRGYVLDLGHGRMPYGHTLKILAWCMGLGVGCRCRARDVHGYEVLPDESG